MWFIAVEVEQETSAPPANKNPGSAPDASKRECSLLMQVHGLEVSAIILYTVLCLYSGLSLSLKLVASSSFSLASSRKVVIGLCATRALERCTV